MRRIAAAASVLALASTLLGVAVAQTLPVSCPTVAGDTLQFVDVLDGSPEEQAFLVPDSATDERGLWNLGYVYDAGRFVTVRCKYGRGRAIDLKIATRIAQCQYTSEGAAGLKMVCR
jgi:hypothetical protein